MISQNIQEILDFAIEREQEAHDFYVDLSKKMDHPHLSKVFNEFAREELGHKAKLEAIKSGRIEWQQPKKVIDLKIADYTVEVNPEAVVDYQQALIVAMKREKTAFRLYMDIADSADDENIKSLFVNLANEEAKHKMRFEVEYDEIYMQEN